METSYVKIKGPRACITCAKAKSRCLPGPTGERCERCTRLHKPCSSQTPAPPRKKKEPKPTKVAELERRLVELTNRIESSYAAAVKQNEQRREQATTSRPKPASPAETSQSVLLPQDPENSPSSLICKPRRHDMLSHIFREPEETPDESPVTESPQPVSSALSSITCVPGDHTTPRSGHALQTPPSSYANESSPGYTTPAVEDDALSETLWPRALEAELWLEGFRVNMAHLMPFVVFPSTTTAQDLWQKKPLLWKAVMIAACQYDGPRQIAMGRLLQRDLAEATTTKPQKGLEVLQAMEMLLYWFHYDLNSFQVTNLLYMMRSLCVGYGWSESQNADKFKKMGSSGLEQMRAYCGVYYISTLIFTTNKKHDSLMATPFLEACCQAIEERMEYPNDELLVAWCRAQQLLHAISVSAVIRNPTIGAGDMPLMMTIRSFQQQIDTFASSLRPHIRNEGNVVAHLNTAQMMLYETALQDSASKLPQNERLELLWKSLRAAKAFLANKFLVVETPQDKPRFSCLSAFELLFTFQMSLRLNTLVMPGWDLTIVRSELSLEWFINNFGMMLEMCAMVRMSKRQWRRNGEDDATFEQAPAQDPFHIIAMKLKALKAAIRYELASLYAVQQDGPGSDAVSGSQMVAASRDGMPEGNSANVIEAPFPDVAGMEYAPMQSQPPLAVLPGLEGMTLDVFQDMDPSIFQELLSNNQWPGDNAGDLMALDGWQV